jgi:hypothetical protein
MQSIDRFLPDVRVYAPACSDFMAFRFIRDAARELCARTRIWKEWDSFTVNDPTDEILTTIVDAEIIDIEAARLDDHDLEPVTPAILDEKHPGWSTDTAEGTGRYITQLIPNRVALYPRATGSLRVRLVLKPSLQSTSFPDFLYFSHANLIGKGAAGKALQVPETAYTNPQAAAALLAQFEQGDTGHGGVAGLVQTASRGQQRAPRRTKPQWF